MSELKSEHMGWWLVQIKYTTKTGEQLFYAEGFDMDNEGQRKAYESWSFEKWWIDRMQYEDGWFPCKDGRIHVDALLKIEEVSRGPAY